MDETSSVEQTLQVMTGKADQKLLAQVNGYLAECKGHRLQFERQWYMNMAFYFGKQWVQWLAGAGSTTSRLNTPAAPPWRVRLVANKIKPVIRGELAKLTKEKPQPFVVPASSDDEDLLAARAGEQIFEHHVRELKYNKELRKSLFWMVLCGSSYVKIWWDPNTVITDDIIGSVQCEKVSPFHLYVPLVQEEDIERQPYVIHTLAKTKKWVRDTYNVNVDEDVVGGADLLEDKLFSALDIKDRPKNLVSIHEAWIKPCKEYPKGCVVTWTGQTVLSKFDSWPYAHGEFPFIKYDHIPSGKFYSDSVIPDLIPLQKEYNRTRSQIIEAKNRMAKPQLISPRGAVDPNKMTSEPGLIIEYTPGFQPPSPLPLQGLPSYVMEELDRNQRDMDDISAQHEVTKGRTPPGVTAATAISYLQEEDDSKLSWSVSSIEEGTEKFGRQVLSLVQQFWTIPRIVKVAGDDNTYESVELAGSSLGGNIDLRIESGSAMPRSRAAKQAFFMDLGDRGWIPPDRVLRYMEMAETGRLYEEMHLDQRQAQRESVRMSKGDQSVTVNAWDNHQAHIDEHNNYRKRQKFELLPDEIKTLFQQHIEMHEQLIVQQGGGMAPPGAPLPPGMGGPEGSAPGGPPAPPKTASAPPGPIPS